MDKQYRRGKYATYADQQYELYETDEDNICELVDRNSRFEELKKFGFIKSNETTSYIKIEKKLIRDAFLVETYVKYSGFKFFLENVFEKKYILRPLDDAMTHFKDFPKHGYDPIYEVEESKIEEIWEERKALDEFVFDAEPIVYIHL